MRLPTFFYLLLAAAFLAGCAGNDIHVNDGAFLPSARMSVGLSKHEGAPTTPQSGHAIEGSYHGARGHTEQERETGDDNIDYQGVTFVAPVELNHDYSFRSGEIMYRWRKFFGQRQSFGVEALGGVGHNIFYLTTTAAGGLAASHKFNSTGLALAVGGIWRFQPQTSLQVRITSIGGSSKEEVSASRFDLHVVHAVSRNVAVRGGLTSWSVDVERTGNSDIRASFGGPAVALEIAF